MRSSSSSRAAAPRRAAKHPSDEPFDVPEVHEHAPASPARDRGPARSCARCRRDPARRNQSRRGQCLDCAVAWSRRAPATRLRRRRRRPRPANAAATASCSLSGTNGGEMSRNTRSATPRARSASAACAKPSSVNRLFSRSSASGCAVSSPIATSSCADGAGAVAMPLERLEQPIDARADERWMRFDDHPRQPGERIRDGVVISLGHGARIEEAAGVIQLHAGHGHGRFAQRRTRRGDLRGNRARAACRLRWCTSTGRTWRTATDIRGR